MNKNIKIIIGAVIAILIVIVPFYSSYNKLVTMEEDVNRSWAQVENQLKRRNDLIPNLVNVVQAATDHESEVLENISNARAGMQSAGTVEETMEADQQMTSALSRLLVVVESYPTLASSEQFIGLRDELAGTENRIAVERQRFNESVSGFNTSVRRLPASLFANAMGFEQKPYFEITEAESEVPVVDFE